MASAPGTCCVQTNFHKGTPKGSHSTVYGLDTYITGPTSDKVVVLFSDVYGNRYNNTLLIADQIAANGFRVFAPDILKGELITAAKDLPSWIANHPMEETDKMVDDFLRAMRADVRPTFVGAMGYCFGARYALRQISKNRLVDIAAIAHPSLVTIEEFKAITKPLLVSAAESDEIFPTASRHEAELELAKDGKRYQIDVFSGTTHGFACRGDVDDPQEKYAMDKALLDQIVWFKSCSNKT